MILETKKDKGRAGLSMAIAYFGSNGYTVSLPLNDTQTYDLIVDKNSILTRVSVKFTGYKPKLNYQVDLRSCGGTKGAIVYSNFIESDAEALFVMTIDNEFYFIPKSAIKTNTSFVLGPAYDEYKVKI